MSTELHLTKLTTEELRAIIRALSLKTSIKGYSKMRHADLVAELAKLISIEVEGEELVLNKRQLVPNESFRITQEKPVEGGAVLAAKKPRSKVEAPSTESQNTEKSTLDEFTEKPQAEKPQDAAPQNSSDDSDAAIENPGTGFSTSASSSKRVPAPKKKAPKKVVQVQSEPSS